MPNIDLLLHLSHTRYTLCGSEQREPAEAVLGLLAVATSPWCTALRYCIITDALQSTQVACAVGGEVADRPHPEGGGK